MATVKPTKITVIDVTKNRVRRNLYIRVPLTERFGDNLVLISVPDTENEQPQYKLIDRVPYPDTETQNQRYRITTREPYVLLYDTETKNAVWSYEILNTHTLENNIRGQNKPNFHVDPELPEEFQTPEGRRKYNEPYNRGHLTPASDHRLCVEDYKSTFRLSNIVPQHKDINSDEWTDLEGYCRFLTKKICNVHVYTGPLYLTHRSVPGSGTEGGKKVPTHIFKLIIVEEADGTVREPEIYRILNDRSKVIETFWMTLEEIERDSGVKFTEERSAGEANNKTWTVTPGENRPKIEGRITRRQ